MNILQGHITAIKNSGAMMLTSIEVAGHTFTALSITGQKASSYHTGDAVEMLFKENEVVLAREWSGNISMRNQLSGMVQSLETDDLLASVTLDTPCGPITSIITAASAHKLGLAEGVSATAFIKTNEMIIRPVTHEV